MLFPVDDILKPWLEMTYDLLNWDYMTQFQYPDFNKTTKKLKKQIKRILDDIEKLREKTAQEYMNELQSGYSDVEPILPSSIEKIEEQINKFQNELTAFQIQLAKMR